jgi:hypothetical protein
MICNFKLKYLERYTIESDSLVSVRIALIEVS